MHLKTSVLTFLLFILINLNFLLSSAQSNQVSRRKTTFNLENGVALQGYDPVDYFDQQKSIKGNKSYIFNSERVLYYLSIALNLEKFKIKLPSFEPQNGGAYAMGDSSHKVEVDPESFKIVNKNYIFSIILILSML